MRKADSILQQFYMSKLPKAQKGLMVPKPAPVYDNIPNPNALRAKAEMEIMAKQAAAARAAREKQGEIRAAEPKRSALSKAWAIATNPMTALAYKVKGQDIPEHFERGERNNLDIPFDILNPFGYANAAGNVASGTGRVIMNPTTIGNEAPGILLNGLQALPLVGNAGMFTDFMRPSISAARNTFNLTADLPMATRLRNAVNAGSLEMKMPGDVMGHSYFGMTPEQVQEKMASEMVNLPKGAYSVDKNMSKNSAPLFWTQAARAPKEYTFVRTGETQPLNWAGIRGKRVVNALPKGAEKYMPDIEEIRNSIQQRVDYLRNSGGARNLAEANRLEKEGLASSIIAEMPYAAYNDQNILDNLSQFMENYKPTLDRPIEAVNNKTSLNFPKTQIYRQPDANWYNRQGMALEYHQPTIYAVKGNPLTRYAQGIKDFAKERATKLYLGDSWLKGAGDNYIDLSRTPQFYTVHPEPLDMNDFVDVHDYNPELKKGGPIVDPRGQWAHPGKDTMIPTPTGQITMQGVPYPVYGQDETGYAQMMYPGGEYTFPGQMVYETPMMSSGGQHGGLDRWFAEKWVDIKTGKQCGRQEGESRRSYPACRPSKRVNSHTPKTSGEMSAAEKEKFKRAKTSSQRIPFNN